MAFLVVLRLFMGFLILVCIGCMWAIWKMPASTYQEKTHCNYVTIMLVIASMIGTFFLYKMFPHA